MTKAEAKRFIEEMDDYGDFYWSSTGEVLAVYSSYSLEDALEERKRELDSEAISVSDAALIWRSHGKDEDYMFGYTEEELENA